MSDVNLFPYIGTAIEMIALLLGLVLVLLFGTDVIFRRRQAREQRRLRAALLATSTRDAGQRVA